MAAAEDDDVVIALCSVAPVPETDFSTTPAAAVVVLPTLFPAMVTAFI